MINNSIYSDKIEKLREHLYKLISIKPICDKEVVQYSQELDKLLNTYNNLNKSPYS
jgi:hypothetical protein